MEGGLSPLLMLGIGGGIAGLFLLWQGRQASLKAGLMVACLWLLFMTLGWQVLQPKPQVLDEAVLLTNGADSGMLRNLLRRLPKGTKVFALPEAAGITLASQQIADAPDVGWLHRNFAKTGTWHLLGWGLPAESLGLLLPARVVAYPADVPLGFEWADWPRTLTLGEALTFRGRLSRPLPEGWQIRLVAPSGEAVAELRPVADQFEIQLQDRPALAGTMLYSVTIADVNGEEVLREAIPVQVTAPRQHQVWMVLGSPRFELKYLKHWLGAGGNRLFVRTQLTESDWLDDAVNRDPLPKDMQAWPWREADVFVTDMAALVALNDGERAALRKAVEAGLGLFLFPEGIEGNDRGLSAQDAAFFDDWRLKWQDDGIEALEVALNWQGQYPTPQEKVATLPAELLPRPGQRMLMDDGFGMVVAAVVRRGAGSVGTSLVSHSYRWALQGDWADFQAYWSQIFTQIGRRQEPPPRWHIDGPVLVGEPAQWQLWAPNNAPFQAGTSGPQRFWESDAMQFGRKSGRLWADAPGWHEVSYGGVPLPAFYAFPKNAWRAAQATASLAATRAFVQKHGQDGVFGGSGWRPSWPVLLGLLLVLLAGALWLGEKLQRW